MASKSSTMTRGLARDGLDTLRRQQGGDGIGVGVDFAVIAAALGGSEFETVERALAGQRLAFVGLVAAVLAERVGAAAGGGEQGIGAQPVVVVEVFVTERQAEHALSNHHVERVLDEIRMEMIGEAAGGFFAEPQAAVHLAQQQHAAVAGKMAAGEVRLNTA